MKKYIKNSMTFQEYRSLIDDQLAAASATGSDQSESLNEFTRLNCRRMDRLAKTVELTEGVKAAARTIDRPLILLILTEGWCGDAAQNIPAIEKISAESGMIETRYLLRDQNPDLMDMFLTDGARSIPKLIALDAETLEVLGSWGARPNAAQDYFMEMKQAGHDKPWILENMQRWYNSDKTLSIQKEFEVLLNSWKRDLSAAAAA